MKARNIIICPLLPLALILLLSLASCNLCERKIPAIRQHDHSVKAVTELPEDYGRLNPDRDFGDADSSVVSFLIDSRDGSFARGYSNDEFRVVFEWHDGNGRLIASGTRYVGAKTYEYGGWYDFCTYEYDEDGRETLSRTYERTKGTKIMRLSREHRSVYGDGGLSKTEITDIVNWIRLLVSYGADKTLRDEKGLTALDYFHRSCRRDDLKEAEIPIYDEIECLLTPEAQTKAAVTERGKSVTEIERAENVQIALHLPLEDMSDDW